MTTDLEAGRKYKSKSGEERIVEVIVGDTVVHRPPDGDAALCYSCSKAEFLDWLGQ